LFDVTVNFAITDIISESVIESEDVRKRIELMVSRVLSVRLDACKCNKRCLTLKPLISKGENMADQFGRNKSHQYNQYSLKTRGKENLRASVNLNDFSVMTIVVSLNLTLNTVDFVDVNDNVTTAVAKLSRRITGMGKNMAWYFFMSDSQFDNPQWLGSNANLIDPSVTLIESALARGFLDETHYFPSIEPTSMPVSLVNLDSNSKAGITLQEIIGVSVSIGGLLIIPAIMFCFYKLYKSNYEQNDISEMGVSGSAGNSGNCQSCYQQTIAFAHSFCPSPSSVCSSTCCDCCAGNSTIVLPNANTTSGTASWSM
jgi:hypothetical protein